MENEKSDFKPAVLHLKTKLVLHPACDGEEEEVCHAFSIMEGELSLG